MELNLPAELTTSLGLTQQESSCPTVIGENCTVAGIRTGVALVVIEGHCNGSVETDGVVIVLEKGRVSGNIKARAASIAGKVHPAQGPGLIDTLETLYILSTAEVQCDISAAKLDTSPGALINGQVMVMSAQARQTPAALFQAENTTATVHLDEMAGYLHAGGPAMDPGHAQVHLHHHSKDGLSPQTKDGATAHSEWFSMQDLKNHANQPVQGGTGITTVSDQTASAPGEPVMATRIPAALVQTSGFERAH